MERIKYNIAKTIGYILRYLVCAITIDKINVSESIILSYCIISPAISWTLWKISRCTCKKIVYEKLEPTAGSIGYTIAYLIYLMILFIILLVFKHIGIIPFANDFDENLFNFIIQYFNNLIMDFSNKIVEVLQVTN